MLILSELRKGRTSQLPFHALGFGGAESKPRPLGEGAIGCRISGLAGWSRVGGFGLRGAGRMPFETQGKPALPTTPALRVLQTCYESSYCGRDA
jgi:hypothetical protein